ncbi:ATP synthase F1 subunit epsilon [Elstera litoralis]|uniref:ATP synthase F1 subunit epsilon n=1 Tax=Elstera litoralis TaxID=552518 RepID=UPI000A028785
MAGKITFELVSPERLVLSKPVDMVVMPGTEGEFGVLVGHAPILATLDPGVVAVHDGGQIVDRIFVAGGFAEVTAERCVVLAEDAVSVKTIDVAAAAAPCARRKRAPIKRR